MTRKVVCLALALALLLAAFPATSVDAARGEPGNPEFGYGITLSAAGPLANNANFSTFQNYAQQLKPDWVAVDFDWSAIQPDARLPLDLKSMDALMNLAADNQLPVLLRLVNAPPWAQTAYGPKPQLTEALICELYARYPAALQAIEVFPGANTLAGWGALPDPAAYTHLFSSLSQNISQPTEGKLILVAAGLQITDPANRHPLDADALDFLTGLYQSGIQAYMPVLSLQYQSIAGEPLDPVQSGQTTLRDYEEVRRIMLAHDHSSGLLWITRLSAPVSAADPITWIETACELLRSQLYMGAVFIDIPSTAASQAGFNGALIYNLSHADKLIQVLHQFIFKNAPEEWLPPAVPQVSVQMEG